jgi:hypothetical protein
MKNISLVAITLLFIFSAGPLRAQDDGGRIVFTDPKSSQEKPLSEEDLQPHVHAWGMDVMIGTDGFGFGGFYNRVLSDEWTLSASLTFSEAKDTHQKDTYDYWGQQISLNKINRIHRIPLLFGVQYRLFKDEISDNFRPFASAGAGPVFLFITPCNSDFFSDLDEGYFKMTLGGYVGIGANFGFDRSTVLGVNIRYYVIPVPKGIQSVYDAESDTKFARTLANANGFFVSLSFGTAF